MISASGSCSHLRSANQSTVTQTGFQHEGIPLIQELDDLKSISEPVNKVVDGSAATLFSSNALAEASDLELLSSVNTTSWGIWCVKPDDDELLSATVLFHDISSEVNIGVADFASGRWDWNGPLQSGIQLMLDDDAHRSASGNCYIAVLVSGGSGAVVDGLIVSVNELGWHLVTIDSGVLSGGHCSLTMVDGHPAVAYDDGDSVIYVRSSDPAGLDESDWLNKMVLGIGMDSPVGNRICLVSRENGQFPSLAYTGRMGEFTKVAYRNSNTSTGSLPADWAFAKFLGESGVHTGTFCSLAMINSHPAVSFVNWTDGELRYAVSSTSDGDDSDDWTTVTIQGGAQTGYTSLALVDGNPALSYYSSGNLMYVRSDSPQGTLATDWITPITVDSNELVGASSSLAVVLGNPAIAYWDAKNDIAKYKRSGTSTGTGFGAWDIGAPQVIDPNDSSGLFTSADRVSLSFVDGNPAAAYMGYRGFLLYKRSSRKTGDGFNAWSSSLGSRPLEDPDSFDFVSPTSLLEVNGRPAICFYSKSGNNTRSYIFATLLD